MEIVFVRLKVFIVSPKRDKGIHSLDTLVHCEKPEKFLEVRKLWLFFALDEKISRNLHTGYPKILPRRSQHRCASL